MGLLLPGWGCFPPSSFLPVIIILVVTQRLELMSEVAGVGGGGRKHPATMDMCFLILMKLSLHDLVHPEVVGGTH